MELFEGKIAENLFQKNYSRICMCECNICANRSPHPIYNCYQVCRNTKELTEIEKLDLGLYKKCICTCPYCLSCIILN